ncbi:hypothetical protein ALI144C_26785 [Actinosynnema sp. ALI-1.44]|uniref:hypothetical protein n=1 Tax=Actinosynnema sp. ALI-1.44 TaxID=1933779 RepID=UPI00097C3C19|nr:hypothetical protein [Actinosynnema sp. ALI-1.44]ONI79420.1 hypothetical protein ALI144C_26785 [Actinosynnema sp. ALI-1.44]
MSGSTGTGVDGGPPVDGGGASLAEPPIDGVIPAVGRGVAPGWVSVRTSGQRLSGSDRKARETVLATACGIGVPPLSPTDAPVNSR